MSAPNQGRQSPEPERQSDSQQAPMAGNPNDQGQAKSAEEPKESSNEMLKNLESNPKHTLEDAAAEKVTKG